MNDLTPNLQQEFEKIARKYYSSPAPSAEFASLLEARLRQNMGQTQKKHETFERKSFILTSRPRLGIATLTALLLIITLTGVVYAIGKSLGYFPGIGLVKPDAPIRVLAAPVTTNNNGIIFTITQVVADSERTTIVYSIDAPDPAPGPLPQPVPGEPVCKYLPDFISHFIRLPNGQILNGGNGEPVIGEDSNLAYFKVIDGPIPQDVTSITVVLGCDQGEASVHLKPASSNAILPVITSPSATPEVKATDTIESNSLSVPTPVPDDLGFSMELDKVVELESGYLLIGKMHWANTNLVNVGISSENTMIVDANGNPVSFTIETSDPTFWELDSVKQSASWAFNLAGKDHTWPINISLRATGGFPPVEAGSFQMDLGANPQVNQPLNLNLGVPVKNAGVIRINSVTLMKGIPPLEDSNSYGLNFAITPAFPVLTLTDKNHPSSYWGGGGGPEEYTTSFIYKGGYLPNGPLTITVMYSYPILPPNLSLEWQPQNE